MYRADKQEMRPSQIQPLNLKPFTPKPNTKTSRPSATPSANTSSIKDTTLGMFIATIFIAAATRVGGSLTPLDPEAERSRPGFGSMDLGVLVSRTSGLAGAKSQWA